MDNEKYKCALAEFLIKKGSTKFKVKAKSSSLVKLSILANVTNTIVTELNEQYKKDYNTTFSKQFSKNDCKENTPPLSAAFISRETVRNLEEQWKETAVERLALDYNLCLANINI